MPASKVITVRVTEDVYNRLQAVRNGLAMGSWAREQLELALVRHELLNSEPIREEDSEVTVTPDAYIGHHQPEVRMSQDDNTVSRDQPVFTGNTDASVHTYRG